MKKNRRNSVACSLIVLTIITSGWGSLVHKTTHQLATYELPKKLQKFYYQNLDTLVASSTRPDIRRNTDTTEASKHFIDLEAYGDSAAYKMPLQWSEAVKIYSEDSLLKYGYVPYHIIYMKNKLTEAFRKQNADSILFYSADLGHYIEDANVPLHTSINYDGQLSNQKGLHSLWESTVPEVELTNYNLFSRHKAKYISHPEEDIMNSIRRASKLLPDVFAKEKEISATFSDSQKYVTRTSRSGGSYTTYSPAFAKAYSASLKNTINDQLIFSANQVADFWYTCWADAGKPDLQNLTKTPYTKADKKAFKATYKSFKKNSLISNNYLLAKKENPVRKVPE